MKRRLGTVLASVLLGLLATTAACSQAYSTDRAAAPGTGPVAIADGPVAASASPYGVEIRGEDGATLATYQKDGRFYVLGAEGSRYVIHVSNPTDRRVEAVVTVDGLDVIDGEAGDLRKRGYVVPAHGDLSIEGFRTSTQQVATFRFSSVDGSYAGRKGKARNVGVIAVALFEETPPAEIILEEAPPPPPPPVPYYDDRLSRDEGSYDKKDVGGGGEGRAARRPAAVGGTASAGDAAGAPAPAKVWQPPPDTDGEDSVEAERRPDPCSGCSTRTHRPGLGTEYGEQRYSAASWTRFVRASDTPTAVAELRYNDAAGLAALGIQVAPPVDAAEVTRRETADPFPGDQEFSRPPAGVR